MTKALKVKKPKARNLHACHPLMRKGGAHSKTKKAERRAEKMQLKRDYLGENLLAKVFFSKVFRICYA